MKKIVLVILSLMIILETVEASKASSDFAYQGRKEIKKNGQTKNILHSETFDGDMPADWEANLITGEVNWTWTDIGSVWGGELYSTTYENGYMMLDSYGLGTIDSLEEADLISSSYNCSQSVGDVYFSLEHHVASYLTTEVSIFVSNDDFVSETLVYDWAVEEPYDENGDNPVLSEFNITDVAVS